MSSKEFTELIDSLKALVEQSKQTNIKLDALIALQRGVATTGTLIPAQTQEQAWLGKIGQLCNRSKGHKTDDVLIVYNSPQLMMVDSKQYKSE